MKSSLLRLTDPSAFLREAVMLIYKSFSVFQETVKQRKFDLEIKTPIFSTLFNSVGNMVKTG